MNISKYVEIQWKAEWFTNRPKFPKKYWYSLENCANFLNSIASGSGISNVNEWKRISASLIKNMGGSVMREI